MAFLHLVQVYSFLDFFCVPLRLSTGSPDEATPAATKGVVEGCREAGRMQHAID